MKKSPVIHSRRAGIGLAIQQPGDGEVYQTRGLAKPPGPSEEAGELDGASATGCDPVGRAWNG